LRYIIADIEGIKYLINIVHSKLITPKNKSLNVLIYFMYKIYSLNILESNLDCSYIGSNSWFTGFTEGDGHLGVKMVDLKAKSETRRRSYSSSVSLRYRLDKGYFYKSNTSMVNIMEII